MLKRKATDTTASTDFKSIESNKSCLVFPDFLIQSATNRSLRATILFMNLGLLVENIEPAIATFHVERADPARRRDRIMTNGVLSLTVREQRGVLVQHLQFELIKLVTFDRANRAAHERHDLGLVRAAAV